MGKKDRRVYSHIVIRKDLTPVQKIVQASHAAMAAGEQFECSGQFLRVHEVENEKELEKFMEVLDLKGITYTLFIEPDNRLGKTALCTIPSDSNQVRNFFKKIPIAE